MKAKVIIFGASTLGRTCYKELNFIYNVLFYCDNDDKKWGKEFEGKIVISPYELYKYKSECAIIIASAYYTEIIFQLLKMNINNIKIFKIEQLCEDKKSSYQLEELSENDSIFLKDNIMPRVEIDSLSNFEDSTNYKIFNNQKDIFFRGEVISKLNKFFLIKGSTIALTNFECGDLEQELVVRNSNCISLQRLNEQIKSLRSMDKLVDEYSRKECMFYNDKEANYGYQNYDISLLNDPNDLFLSKHYSLSRLSKFIVFIVPSNKNIKTQNKIRNLGGSILYKEEICTGNEHKDDKHSSIKYLNYKFYNDNIEEQYTMIITTWKIEMRELFEGLNNQSHIVFNGREAKIETINYKLISIVIPVFNGEKYIKTLVDNIQKITCENLQFVFIDDGSTDKTNSILNTELSKTTLKYKLKRLKENRGLFNARYEGSKNADGDYIFFHDIDDIIYNNGIENLYRDLMNFPKHTLLPVPDALMINNNFTGEFNFTCNYKDKTVYIIYETLKISGSVSILNTLIHKTDVLKAYDELMPLIKSLSINRMSLVEDSLLVSHMIVKNYINLIVPSSYTFRGYETGGSNLSKNVEKRIKDIPILIAYNITYLFKSNILNKDEIKFLEKSVLFKALQDYGIHKGLDFSKNYLIYKDKLSEYI